MHWKQNRPAIKQRYGMVRLPTMRHPQKDIKIACFAENNKPFCTFWVWNGFPVSAIFQNALW
jgi:hypothetical protein